MYRLLFSVEGGKATLPGRILWGKLHMCLYRGQGWDGDRDTQSWRDRVSRAVSILQFKSLWESLFRDVFPTFRSISEFRQIITISWLDAASRKLVLSRGRAARCAARWAGQVKPVIVVRPKSKYSKADSIYNGTVAKSIGAVSANC